MDQVKTNTSFIIINDDHLILAGQTRNTLRCRIGETLVEVLEFWQDVEGSGWSWMDNMEDIGQSK